VTGLVALRAHDAVPELLVAVDRRIPKSASAVGELCTGEDCAKLAERIGAIPFETLATGFQPILRRADVADDVKLKVIAKARAAETSEAMQFLKDMQRAIGATAPARVKQALDQAAAAAAAVHP